MSGRKHSVALRSLVQLPAETVIANITGSTADAAHVTLTDLATALGVGGEGIADGDKGDIVVSASGATWMFDSAVVTAAAKTVLDDASVSAMLATMGGAPLASPTLTGTPAAPTAAPGTNTTQISTTAFVQAAIAALINSAPGALDTLDELAAALADDASFASTMTTALAGKAPLASPTLTGVPAAPTAAPGTNTTQLASTAFVTAAIAAAPGGGATFGSAVIDFGGTPEQRASVTVTGQASILSGAHVNAWLMAEATAEHNAYEHEMAPIKLTCGTIVAATGFTVVGVSEWRLTGTFNLRWSWANP